MTVTLTAEATDDPDEIWPWNVRTYSVAHANRHLSFLRGEIDKLDVNPSLGATVPGWPAYRHVLVRRRRRGSAHIPVDEVSGTTVTVLRISHSAQDWQRTLAP